MQRPTMNHAINKEHLAELLSQYEKDRARRIQEIDAMDKSGLSKIELFALMVEYAQCLGLFD